jgi:hypothetical protein
MTKDEAKEFLNRGYQSRIRIRAKKERIENWRRIAESITAAIKPVAAFSSMPSKKVEDCVCNIIELQEEIQEEIDGLVQVEREIGRAITKAVEDPTLRALLEMRYLNYLKWEEIAVRLDVTFRWTMTLHRRALEEFSSKAR